MKKSLSSIIEEVIGEEAIMSERTLLRRFYKLIAVCGGNIDMMKDENGHIFFDESEVQFLKVILEELYLNEGIASAFIDKQTSDDYVGLEMVHDFIQKFLEKLSDSGASEDEIQSNLNFLGMLFLLPVKENNEYCHRLLAAIYQNLEQYPYTHQAIMSNKITNEMKRMFACSMAEAMVNLVKLCEIIKAGQELSGEKNSLSWYGDDDIAIEYKERDRRAFRMMKNDDRLREYVEEKLNMKIEDLFPEIEKEWNAQNQ